MNLSGKLRIELIDADIPTTLVRLINNWLKTNKVDILRVSHHVVEKVNEPVIYICYIYYYKNTD